MQRRIVELVDDLDGSDAEETVLFGLDGQIFEIDLNAKNANALRQVLARYVSAGRRTGARLGQRRPRSESVPVQRNGDASDAAAIREWAIDNGYQVSTRGRISAELRAAYLSA